MSVVVVCVVNLCPGLCCCAPTRRWNVRQKCWKMHCIYTSKHACWSIQFSWKQSSSGKRASEEWRCCKGCEAGCDVCLRFFHDSFSAILYLCFLVTIYLLLYLPANFCRLQERSGWRSTCRVTKNQFPKVQKVAQAVGHGLRVSSRMNKLQFYLDFVSTNHCSFLPGDNGHSFRFHKTKQIRTLLQN